METRAVKNPYPDYDGQQASTQSLFDSQGKVPPSHSHPHVSSYPLPFWGGEKTQKSYVDSCIINLVSLILHSILGALQMYVYIFISCKTVERTIVET